MINSLNKPSTVFIENFINYIIKKSQSENRIFGRKQNFKYFFQHILNTMNMSIGEFIKEYEKSYKDFNVNISENIDKSIEELDDIFFVRLLIAMPPDVIKIIYDTINEEKNDKDLEYLKIKIFKEQLELDLKHNKSMMELLDTNTIQTLKINEINCEINELFKKLDNEKKSPKNLYNKYKNIVYSTNIKDIFKIYDFRNLYETFRNEDISNQYIKNIDTLMCPYCNIDDFSITDNHSKKVNSKFQLDHFYDKSTYPYFAISIYNLIPCCQKCNSDKKNEELNCNPYLDKPQISFSISNENDIEINTSTYENLEDIKKLKITEKYNSEFSIIKHEIVELKDIVTHYNESYLELIKKLENDEADENNQKNENEIKQEFTYWQKKSLKDGLIDEKKFGTKRLSNAKSSIVRMGLGEDEFNNML